MANKIKANMNNMGDVAITLETTINKIFGGYLGQPIFYQVMENNMVKVTGCCVLQKNYGCSYLTDGKRNKCYDCNIYMKATGDYSEML